MLKSGVDVSGPWMRAKTRVAFLAAAFDGLKTAVLP
jgi:hypothetical protein